MANNYLQFAQTVEDLTDAEMKWLQSAMAVDDEWEDPENYADGEFLGGGKGPPDWYDRDIGGIDFQCEVTPKDRTAHFYAEESGDVDAVAKLMVAFLRAHRPNDCFELTYACTCDKMRSGEFSGGAVFVTADGYEGHGACTWLDNIRGAWERKKSR